MSAKTLTAQEAESAGIALVEPGKGEHAVHQTVVAMRANRRRGTACAKTRAEVNRSGRKPWRQKGTGRARSGDAGSPIWVGGGVVFGPRPRDYSKKVPKKVRRLAFRKALTERLSAGDVLVVESFDVENVKTKEFVTLLSALSPSPKTLVIGVAFRRETYLAGRNVPGAHLCLAKDVNTEQLLAFDKILVTRDGLEALGKRTAA